MFGGWEFFEMWQWPILSWIRCFVLVYGNNNEMVTKVHHYIYDNDDDDDDVDITTTVTATTMWRTSHCRNIVIVIDSVQCIRTEQSRNEITSALTLAAISMEQCGSYPLYTSRVYYCVCIGILDGYTNSTLVG